MLFTYIVPVDISPCICLGKDERTPLLHGEPFVPAHIRDLVVVAHRSCDGGAVSNGGRRVRDDICV